MIGPQKNERTLLSPKLQFNRKTCSHFLKSRCISKLSCNILKNTNAQVLLFFTRASNKQQYLKTTGVYEDLLLLFSLFPFFYFIFSAPISFILCFPISSSLFFYVLKRNRKALVYIYSEYIYFRKFMNFCITKNL